MAGQTAGARAAATRKKTTTTSTGPASSPKPASRGEGWKVIVKINLPPETSYHSGHSLMVQGDDPLEVQNQLAELIGNGHVTDNERDQARFILLRFVEYAQQGALKQALDPGTGAAPAPTSSGAGGADTEPTSAPAPADESSTDGATPAATVAEAAQAAADATPPGERPASETLKAFAANKLGKPVTEFDGMTEDEVKALLK
jgi:hypothetical protein